MVAVRCERHRPLLTTAAGFAWFVIAVDLADLRQDASTGRAAKIEALLFQGGLYPDGSDLRVLG